MGCFLGCFGSSKNRKRRKSTYKILLGDQRHGSYQSLQSTVCLNEENSKNNVTPVPELRDKGEEPLNISTRKRVTFDLNVKIYEDKNYLSDEERERGNEEEKVAICLLEDYSFPLNHRYQNYRYSDEEDEIDSIESDLEEDDDEENYYDDGDEIIGVQNQDLGEEESYESFFSISIESQTRDSSTSATEKEVNSPISICVSHNQVLNTSKSNRNGRDRSQYVHSVLNPVENLSQWKSVKAGQTLPLKYQMKENLNLFQEQSFKQSTFNSYPNINQSKIQKQELAVDASLSNWLISSETTKTAMNGAREEQPLLSSLPVSTSERSTNRSPDENPILGTVETYWKHRGQVVDSSSGSTCKGIPVTNSKFREDNRENWKFSPLKEALNRGVAEACCS